jgi:hypothetical protein
MSLSTGRPLRIATLRQLVTLRLRGHGYVVNEHFPRADGTRKKPTLHGVMCSTLEGVGPEFKLFFEDSRASQRWMNFVKGAEGNAWSRCRVCGGVNPGERVHSTTTVLVGARDRKPAGPHASRIQRGRTRKDTTSAVEGTGGSSVKQLWCDAGGHYWFRPPTRGRRPTVCPEHAAVRDVPHPSTDRSCFRLEFGWSLRLEVSGHLRNAHEIEVPEALSAAIGLLPQLRTEVGPIAHQGPSLKLWRGRGGGKCTGQIGDLMPADAADGDRLFISFNLPHYQAKVFAVPGKADSVDRLTALVGLPSRASADEDIWHAISRRLGVSVFEPHGLEQVAMARGDSELAEAITAASRVIRTGAGWPGAWDLISPLGTQPRQLALTNGKRWRVAVGVADPRDRLAGNFLVTPGGLVWVEVSDPDEARQLSSALPPDVNAPAQSERWVQWMRVEHAIRRASLAGVEWRLIAGGQDWKTSDGRAVSNLRATLETLTKDAMGTVPEGRHLRHIIPRSAIAIERAFAIARAGGLHSLESDASTGFASIWLAGRKSSSSLLGALRPE